LLIGYKLYHIIFKIIVNSFFINFQISGYQWNKRENFIQDVIADIYGKNIFHLKALLKEIIDTALKKLAAGKNYLNNG
jgi:hypothetical protein